MEDEKKTTVPEPGDVLMQNSFPSSTVDAPDGHFYHIQPREHDMDPDPDQLVQQALASLAEHHEQQQQSHAHGHMPENEHDQDLRELQALQEQEPQPQEQQHAEQAEHQAHHPNVDELRLAAQLSQDLAPIMAEAAQEHAQGQGQQQLPQGPDNGHMQESHGQVDPDLHQQLQAELQNHDQELQDILPPTGQQGNIPSEHQYHSNAPSPAHHGLPTMPMDAYQYPVDNTPPRKRSKVSRACDECRRKKIKCDAQSDAIDQPCTNCRRSSAQCLFSRVPQKRGPSKGYIKELADRINTIEGKLVGSVESLLEGARRTPTETFPSPQPADESRKRQYSSISGDGFPTPTSASGRNPPWPTEHRAIRPFIRPEERPAAPFSVNSLAPRPATPPTLPNNDTLPPRTEPNVLEGMTDGLQHDPLEPAREIDDEAFNCYLAALHPTFPVLARTKARVQNLVSQCPPTLQSAFHDAFLDFTRPALRHAALVNGEIASSAERLLFEWELERRPAAHATDLVYFLTTVMMALCYDRSHPRGSRRAALIAKAAAIGYSHKIYRAQPDPVPGPEFDPDSDHNVALRAWWTLVMFDRWNAIATGVPMFISNDTAVMVQGLKPIVGDGFYQLLQLSHIIGSFVPFAQGTKPGDDCKHTPMLAKNTIHNLQQYLLQFPPELDEGRFQHVHLAYWHTSLLAHMLSPTTWIEQIFQDCDKLISMLASTPPHTFNPLHHHFVNLLSAVLVELTKAPLVRDDAIQLIKEMLDRAVVSSPRNTAVREKIADRLPTQNGEANDTNVKNLQQLADLATATGPTSAPLQNGEAPRAPPAPMEAVALDPVSAAAPPSALKTDQGDQGVDADQLAFDSITECLRVGYLTVSEKRGEAAGTKEVVR